MSSNSQEYPDVLVRAAPDDVTHKLREEMDDPWSTECFWSVSGTPQRTGPGGAMLFHDGEEVWGVATVTRVEEGRIWFKPIRRSPWVVETPDPPTRGFAYVGGDDS